MSNFSYFIGIDVAKDKIDVFSTQTSSHFTVNNSSRAIRHALYDYDRENTVVISENTGGYENVCIDTSEKIGYKIHKTNNNRVKNFIKSRGINAKTDKIDAKALAQYGQFLGEDLVLYQKNERQEEIREIATFIESIKTIRASLKNRFKSPNCKLIHDSVKTMIDFLNDEIEKPETKSDNIINKNPDLRDRISLLLKYKGVGKETAGNLIAFLPELGKIDAKSIASLAGVAPHPKDSGKIRGYRSTAGTGRPMVKKVLFMAVLSATRYNENLSEFYQKKLADGKKKMVAMVACMRKMLIQLNAIIKKGAME